MNDMKTLPKLSTWVMAVRPKTLTAAIVPVLVGSSIAVADSGRTQWSLVGLALLAALLIQVATNLVNDALDFERGADNELRLGPTRVTQAGLVSPATVHSAGVSCFLLAVLCCAPAVWLRGWQLLLMVMVSCLAGYLYTGGPCPLGYLGLGDAMVVAFFGVVAVCGIHFIHAGGPVFPTPCVVAGFQVGLLASVLLAVNNLRDIVSDRAAGKRTLAVRCGITFTRVQVTATVACSYALGIFWRSHPLHKDTRAAFWMPALSAPLSLALLWQLWRVLPGKPYNKFLGLAAVLHLLFGLLLALAICCRS